MDEFSFIASIKPSTYKQGTLIKGIGDDGAVFSNSTQDIVTAVDTLVEGVHFTNKTMSLSDVGYKLLAVNVSDLAAMGAYPAFYLISIVIPSTYSNAGILQLYEGMSELALTYKMDLIGGDTVVGSELSLSATVIGFVAKSKARYRHDVKVNDIVFVTGTLGDSKVGLEILLGELQAKDRAYFIKRHQRPSPRVDFSQSLQSVKRLALNDVSDGLANELHELAEASNVMIEIDDSKIPVHSSFRQFSSAEQYDWKYFGGEDFELVGTASESDWEFIKKIATNHSLPVKKIGRVLYKQSNEPLVYVKHQDKRSPLKKLGYRHRMD